MRLLRQPVVEAEEAAFDEGPVLAEGVTKIVKAIVGGVGLKWIAGGDRFQVAGERWEVWSQTGAFRGLLALDDDGEPAVLDHSWSLVLQRERDGAT